MDMETGTIRAILKSEARDYFEAIRQGLTLDLFVDEEKRKIFEWVSSYTRDHGSIPPEGEVRKRFPSLFSSDDEPAVLAFYVQELHNRRLHYRLKDAALEVGDLLKAKDPRAALRVLEGVVVGSQDDARSSFDVDLLARPEDRLADYQRMKSIGGMSGIPTPWPKLDQVTLGWKPGELIVISGRPGTGKSWLVVLCAIAAHAAGKIPLIVSREMAAEQFTRRIDAVLAKVPFAGLRSGDLSVEQEERYRLMLEDLREKSRFWVSSDDDAMGVTGLAAKVDSIRPDILFVDGLYLMNDDRGETGWEGIANLTRDLKKLMVRKHIPGVVTTQLNRRSRGLKADTSMLAFGDSIGMNADVAIGLLQTEEMRNNYEMLIRIMKQREGLTLEFKSRWDLELMNFEEIADEPPPADIGDAAAVLDFN